MLTWCCDSSHSVCAHHCAMLAAVKMKPSWYLHDCTSQRYERRRRGFRLGGDAKDCKFARGPVVPCKLARGPVADCKLARGPVAVCKLARGPVAVCKLARGPVADCKLVRGPVAVCKLARGPVADRQQAA